MGDLYWAEATATWQKTRQNVAFLRYLYYVNYIQDLPGVQGLKSRSYIKKIL